MRILDLLYPKLCLHCEKKLHRFSSFFCEECTPFFDFLSEKERCPHCFIEREGRGACETCREKKRWYYRSASCIERRGPLHSFTSHLKNGSMPYLAKTAASFMTIQLERLSWNPEMLIPLPSPFWKTLFKGKNASYLIYEELIEILGMPSYSKRQMTDKRVLIVSLEHDMEAIDKFAHKIFSFHPRKVSYLSLVM